MKSHTGSRDYLAVNLLLSGVILIILGYSLFYSPEKDNYPVPCIHELVTGHPCPSCGMSHAFSLIVRGRLTEALDWNIYSVRLFAFFAIQLVMRITFFLFTLRMGKTDTLLLKADIIISIAMIIFTFYPFMRYLFIIPD